MDASGYPASASLDFNGLPPVLIVASSVPAARRAADTVELAIRPFRCRSMRQFPGSVSKLLQVPAGSKWKRTPVHPSIACWNWLKPRRVSEDSHRSSPHRIS